MKRGLLIGSVIVLGILVLMGIGYVVNSLFERNRVLEQSVRQYERMLQEKEAKIKELEESLLELRKEERLRSAKIQEIRVKRERVRQEVIKDAELVKEFEKLGFRVYLR